MERFEDLWERYKGMTGLQIVQENVKFEDFAGYLEETITSDTLEEPTPWYEWDETDFAFTGFYDDLCEAVFKPLMRFEEELYVPVEDGNDRYDVICDKILEDIKNIIKYFGVKFI